MTRPGAGTLSLDRGRQQERARRGVVKLHGFDLRYRLPLRVEAQCFEWHEGVDPTRVPPVDA